MKALKEPDTFREHAWNYDPKYPVFRYPFKPSFYAYTDRPPLALFGPESQWSTDSAEELYLNAILPYIYDDRNQGTYVDGVFVPPKADANQTSMSDVALNLRRFVPDLASMESSIANYSGHGFYGFGVLFPTPETITIFHQYWQDLNSAVPTLPAFSLVTNKIAKTTNPGSARFVTTYLLVMVSEIVSCFMKLTGFVCLASANNRRGFPSPSRRNTCCSSFHCQCLNRWYISSLRKDQQGQSTAILQWSVACSFVVGIPPI